MRTTIQCVLVCGATMALLGGCAAPATVSRETSSVLPRAEALFLNPEMDWAAGDGAEYARRDGDMRIASNEPLTANDNWPGPVAPNLDYRRTVNLQSSNFGETVLYFNSGPSSGYGTYQGGYYPSAGVLRGGYTGRRYPR